MDLPHTAPLLEVKDLVVEFPTRRGVLRALDGVSFSVAAGEVLGVVGESGAGKSLTGASIIGLLEPPGRIASGSIWFDGQRIDNLNNDTHAHALRVAQVPENIKGFGHVKERNIQAARALWKSLQTG